MIIVNFIIVLGILIFVHELGHFLVAKWLGVKVEKFSLGFGPKIIGYTWGETEYLISAFPLGGYVKMFGEGGFAETEMIEKDYEVQSTENPSTSEPVLTEEDKARSFSHRPVWQRMAVVFAGPAFNMIFAWLIYIGIYSAISTQGYLYLPPKVGNVVPNSPAAVAGIQKGDVLISIDGRKISEFDEIAYSIFKAAPDAANVVVLRGANELSFSIKPSFRDDKDPSGSKKPLKRPIIGISSTGEVLKQPFSLSRVFKKATQRTMEGVEINIVAFRKIIIGDLAIDNLGGPIQIAKQANVTAQAGIMSFFSFMAVVSVSLGVLNLLPVPVLDGGHLLFYTIEIIIRRPVPDKIREYSQQVGMAMLLCLMALAFYNDIMRYFVSK